MKGDALKDKARTHLREMYEEDPTTFQYNESELFRRSGVSRVTLGKWRKAGLIGEWLRELPAAYSVARQKQNELMKEVERLRVDKVALQAEVNSLRNHLCDVYEHLNAQSVEVQFLLDPLVKRLSNQPTSCPLCGVYQDQTPKLD